MDDLGQLLETIRKKAIAEVEQKIADETFQHLRYAKYNARMQEADAQSCIASSCGHSMEIYLKFKDDRVEKASYVTDGEGAARLCGSSAADLSMGKSCSEIMKLTPADVLQRAGRKNSREEKCAVFALTALHKAARQYLFLKKGLTAETDVTSNTRFLPMGKVSAHLNFDN